LWQPGQPGSGPNARRTDPAELAAFLHAKGDLLARISWCTAERATGMITAEVGVGKTVSARIVLASLDPSKHTVIYLPNPMIGVAASTKRSSLPSASPRRRWLLRRPATQKVLIKPYVYVSLQ
jgi:type II secretory pathway predicted ATPase ExeA